MNILNIEHVSKVFGEKVVLDDVSYGVHQGDKIGIIGINGTGKSTILKIIGGLEEPDHSKWPENHVSSADAGVSAGSFCPGLCGRRKVAEGLEY